MLEKCCFWHVLEEPGAESAAKLSACQGLALQKMSKCSAFRNFSVQARPQKSGSEPLRPQNEPVEAAPKLSSGSAKIELPELRIEHEVCGRISNKRMKTRGFRNLFKKENMKKQMLA